MEVVSNNFLPGDPRLIDHIVYELKSQGIFDNFRKECIADVDTKPAYQNLRQRVEGSVTSFLRTQRWKPDMNKNHVREMLRRNISESGFLETGVERIVDQVVNPKINSVFLPQVENVVYKYLGIKKPGQYDKKGETHSESAHNLLPSDLEAISPEPENVSDAKLDVSEESKQCDSKVDEDESPPFEPIDPTSFTVLEENSVDSHLSGFSGLASHDSNHSTETAKLSTADVLNQDSLLSKQSSDDNLTIAVEDSNFKADLPQNSDLSSQILSELLQTSKDFTTSSKDSLGQNTNDSSSQNTKDSLSKSAKDFSGHNSKDSSGHSSKDPVSQSTKDSSGYGSKDSLSPSTKNSSGHTGKDSIGQSTKDSSGPSTKDSLSQSTKDSSGRSSKDSLSQCTKDLSGHSSKDSLSQSAKDSLGHSSKDSLTQSTKDSSGHSNKDSSSQNAKDLSSQRKKSESKDDKKSNDRHRSSDKHRSKNDSKDKDRKSSHNKSKDKSRHHSSRDDDKKYKKDDKERSKSSTSTSSRYSSKKPSEIKLDKDKKENESKVKSDSKTRHSDRSKSKSYRKDDKHHKSSSSKKDTKSKKDDHYSQKEKKLNRRSTDRDSSDGYSGNHSSSSPFTESSNSQKSNSNQNTFNSGESGGSEQVDQEKVAERDEKKKTPAHRLSEILLKYKEKPKFASNFEEAKKLMKIRKMWKKIEKEREALTKFNKTEEDDKVSDKNSGNYEEPINVEDDFLTTSVISKESWDAVEAKVNSENILNIDYNSYSDSTDLEERVDKIAKLITSVPSDDCLYLETHPQSQKYLDLIYLLTDHIENLVSEKTKLLQSLVSESDEYIGDLLEKHVVNKNLPKVSIIDISDDKEILISPSKHRKRLHGDHPDVHNNNKTKTQLDDEKIEKSETKLTSSPKPKRFKGAENAAVHAINFSLPLSPAESDTSLPSEKKSDQRTKRVANKASNNLRNQQRYSSDDLYKPRMQFASRRRTAKNLDPDC